jgi:CheY-like chemotaxis protein
MKEIVDWLINIEKIAGNLYDGASRQFADDHKLSTFLNHMAEDEGWHYHIMGSAAEYLRKEQEIKSELAVDSSVMERIESPFAKCHEMLSAGTLAKESIIDCIIETEYSEWNHIFIYVINTLKQQSREFMYVASKMQHHIEGITEFLTSLPKSDKYLDKIRGIPEVCKRKFLIVDDSEPIRTLLGTLLESNGTVDNAENGKEALMKVTDSYYDVIISDIEMPHMNGIDFCKEILNIDPNIRKRFIFISGSEEEEFMKFISDNNIRFLRKPMNISDIRSYVREILSATN